MEHFKEFTKGCPADTAVGIIAEYNPFHNGHAYQIRRARALTGAKYCVVIMSGDFVQRGAPAMYDKYTRTAMALSSGADLVIEMPAAFAVSSAEDFAACGVACLDKLNVISHLCFGSECGDVKPLSGIADIFAIEPESYTTLLKEHMKQGMTFPRARSLALHDYLLADETPEEKPEKPAGHSLHRRACLTEGLLDSPNNILGIEYCKALKRRNSAILPVTIQRAGNGYHDETLTEQFSSASGIRKALISSEGLETIRSQVPEAVLPLIAAGKPLHSNDFTDVLNTALLRLIEEGKPLSEYADVSEELAERIKRTVLDFGSYEERIRQLKTRQYTYTRISRALLHLMCGIRACDIEAYRKLDYVPYARVLGFKRASSPLLTRIKAAGSIPLITKTADARQILSADAYRMLRQDFYCSHLYDCVWNARYGLDCANEYNRGIVIL